MGGVPGAKHNLHRGTENGLVHCKAWRGGSGLCSKGLGWDSSTHCWQQRGPRVVTECTRAITLNCMGCKEILTPLVLFPPAKCARVLARTEINTTRGKKPRKYGIWMEIIIFWDELLGSFWCLQLSNRNLCVHCLRISISSLIDWDELF